MALSQVPEKPLGLYDPSFDKDSAAWGSSRNCPGESDRKTVNDAMEMLVRILHRGACGCETNTVMEWDFSRLAHGIPPNNPKSHSSRSPKTLKSLLVSLSLSARDSRSVARVGDSSYAAFAAFFATKTPKSLLVSLSLSPAETAECGARGSATPAYAASRPSATKTPKSLLVSLSLSAETAECGARGSATPPTRLRGLPALAIVLGSFMGTDDSKSRARLGSAQGSSSLFDKAVVSLFLRSSSSSSRFGASSVDSRSLRTSIPHVRVFDLRLHGDDVYFSLEDFGFGVGLMGLKLKLAQRFAFKGKSETENSVSDLLFFCSDIAMSRLQLVKTEKTKMEQKKELEEQDKVRGRWWIYKMWVSNGRRGPTERVEMGTNDIRGLTEGGATEDVDAGDAAPD
ncbi:hypothetical protein Syun_012370 [Stephania yunnanensis]|uniref:Uncharacterized protein n=1 Tax=Stephania yunnanensis TaxID=152371 RepID=A0AAP0K0B9_9MAGN